MSSFHAQQVLEMLRFLLLFAGAAAENPFPCAVVLQNSGTALRAFCAPQGNAAAKQCSLTTRSGDLTAACSESSLDYYQRAIYWAAGRDSDGHRKDHGLDTAPQVVVLSGGVHLLTQWLPCWYPLGNFTGLHIPSGVHLFGSFGTEQSIIMPAPNSSTAEQLVLMSDERIGGPNMSIDQQLAPVKDASLRDVTLVGAPGVRSSPLLCDQPQQIGAKALHGVTVSSGSAVQIVNVTVSGVSNTGLNLGIFSQFLPDNSADKDKPSCSNASWCLGRRLFLRDASIRNNTICAAMQGVTVIGRNVTVAENTIALTTKTWTSSAHLFGITMGVSAGFVGSAEVSVIGNRIRGGDYSIGCDGSYPLYTTPPLFQAHWAQILKLYPQWSAKYPHGPLDASGKNLIFEGNDFILAQQVLLDLASSAHAHSADPEQNDLGFISSLRIRDNQLLNSVSGVSIYRTRDSLVSNNSIASLQQPLAMFGVSVSASHSNVISDNVLSGWQMALQAIGAPLDDHRGCGGCQSRWGSSLNAFLANTVRASKAGVVLGVAASDAGRNNQVVGNNIDSASVSAACDYSGAFDTSAAGNTPPSCNGGGSGRGVWGGT